MGNNTLAQQHILQAMDTSGIGGHSGFHGTCHRIKALFSLPKMKTTIREYIKACSICQQANEHVKPPGLLEPLPVPKKPWTVVCMDFIEELPTSNKQNVIMVIIDKFTKYAHFMALSHPFTALQVAQVYLNTVYKLHGSADAIVSNRDRIFTSSVWQQLFRLFDTQLLMSSSYHPQIDGQSERLKQCLETFLRCTVHACPSQWSKWLPLAEYWYNTTFHSALGRSPFEVLYGQSPRHLGISDLTVASVPELADWLKERELLTQVIQHHLYHAQQRMKAQADKGCSERVFDVGSLVYLKLQPYIQTAVAPRSNQKLSFCFYGPFRVLQRIGKVAYKLDLPQDCKIHPVVHVSQLKLHISPAHTVSYDISSLPTDPTQILQLVAVVDHYLSRGSSVSSQVLVQWSKDHPNLMTWEEITDVVRRFGASFPSCFSLGSS